MSQECREVAVQLPYKEIRATLDGYLKRHKFCSDCSKMVNKAYNLLVEDIQVGVKFRRWPCNIPLSPAG